LYKPLDFFHSLARNGAACYRLVKMTYQPFRIFVVLQFAFAPYYYYFSNDALGRAVCAA
jgi:hypothetical protein